MEGLKSNNEVYVFLDIRQFMKNFRLWKIWLIKENKDEPHRPKFWASEDCQRRGGPQSVAHVAAKFFGSWAKVV